MVKKRSRIEVIHNILSMVKDNKNSIKSTPLLRYSNLSSQRFSKYLKELLEKDFIKEIPGKYGKRYYSLTDKGFRFLEKYESIKNLISDFDL